MRAFLGRALLRLIGGRVARPRPGLVRVTIPKKREQFVRRVLDRTADAAWRQGYDKGVREENGVVAIEGPEARVEVKFV